MAEEKGVNKPIIVTLWISIDLQLSIVERLFSSHSIHHNKNKIEDYFELKSIYHEEFNLEDSLNLSLHFAAEPIRLLDVRLEVTYVR